MTSLQKANATRLFRRGFALPARPGLMTVVRGMQPGAVWWPMLLLCVLLWLPLTHGGPRSRRKIEEIQMTTSATQEPSSGIKVCEKRTSIYLCKYPCEVQEDCEASHVCCSTFCGNVCINLL
ncbi:WAP four-disulfide core domain protein 10A-like [Perognathus longimembris pacificus]|uniref:WAP four-disulfide core domain protein 10A-like n=1 Tax=Perognathus longimembris pacificus TaxID=214514 RepID=UPI002019350E|nr:WAP four-disulfide core domain protein 10A-like [Perognathus longimembris pacificus]